MIELSKPLQEDIRKNQLNLKVAIKNHQALVVKLRSTFDDPAEIIKHQLADIQKHIISLGEAQKLLVARVKKEIAAKSWNNNNNNNSVENDTILNSDQVHSTNSLQPSTTSAIKSENSLLENEQRGSKRKKEEDDEDDEDDNDVDDDDEEDDDEEVSLLSAKRHKPMLSDRRPSTPASTQDYQTNEVVGTSSEDSQESGVDQQSPVDEVSKEHFMGILNLITKEIFNQLQSKHRERRRRRLAGRHSLYTSNWDLTVQRRTRTRHEREADRQQDYDRGASPVGSPPIVMVNKGHDSSSESPSPPPVSKREDSSSFKKVCIICRKQGILSICENCSATYHWSCLDKIKICPQCQAEQIVRDSRNNSRSGSNSPNPGDDSVSKVLGDTSKPPTRVSSMEVIARYFNRNSQANNENTYTERLKMKKMLEARKAALKVDLANLEEKASQLSASLVNQTANLKELSAGEEKIRERIKIVVDFISSMKKSESQPS